MALSFRKTARGVVGLDLDGAFLAAVELSGGKLVRAVSTDLAPGLVAEGEVVDLAGLTAALQVFWKAHGLPRRVRLGVANQQIVVRELELPRIEDPREQEAAVRFQAAEAIAMPLEEAVLDYQEIGESVNAEGAARTRFVVVAARAAMIDRIVEAVRGAGLRPEGIDLNAFALIRALAPPSGDFGADQSARVYCHLGGVTNLAVALGSTCLFTRPLSAGATDPFAEDAPPSGPPPAAASAPVEYFSPASPAREAREPGPSVDARVQPVAASARRLAEEIRLSIDFYRSQPEARWVGDIVLSGPGSTRPDLAAELSASLGVPVAVGDPLGGLAPIALPEGEDPFRYTVAAGLALGAA